MRRLRSIVWAAIVGLSASAADAAEWSAFSGLKLFVSDTLDAHGRIFRSGGHFLVLPAGSPQAYLLTPKKFTLHRLNTDELSFADGSPQLDPSPVAEKAPDGALEVEGAALRWEDGGYHYRMDAKPPLIGPVTLEELRKYTAKYEPGIEGYTPDAEAVETLRKISDETELVVGFGTWCSICAEWLPRFIKTMLVADNPEISFRYISISSDLARPDDLLERYNISSVPIFIVRRGDRELGRIDSDQLEDAQPPALERMIGDILNGHGE
jgi:hypothetical protein